MPQETYDWSADYSDEQSGTTTTFTSLGGDTVNISVSQPDPLGVYRPNRDGFEANSTLGGSSSGFFEMGVNFANASQTVTTIIDFTSNTLSGENSVTDVSFTLFDLDSPTDARFVDEVTVLAFDADGNALTVTLTAQDSSVVSVSGSTATAIPGAATGPLGSVGATSAEGNVDVFISGEVASIQIVYGNGAGVQANPANQVVGIGDLSFDLTPPIICFTAGTQILTPQGQRAVETLCPGDLVVTRDHGMQPVRWTGLRKVAGRGALAPVRFAPGAIGNSVELILSPQHRVLARGWRVELFFGEAEVLVPAKQLVNGTTIRQEPCDEVEYVHFACDAHEIVLADGAMCETLHLGPVALNAMPPDARRELEAIFPEIAADVGRDALPLARHSLKSFEARLIC